MIRSFKELRDSLSKVNSGASIVVSGGEDIETLKAVKMSYDYGIGKSILVGESKQIEVSLKEVGSSDFVEDIIHSDNDFEKARLSIVKAIENKNSILVKGQIKTAILLGAVLDKQYGIRGKGILSGVSIFEDPRKDEEKLVILSDGGVNIEPDFDTLVAIVRNAVETAHILGNDNPRVAMLAAVEMINPKMKETLNAALLSKMANRNQIKGCVIDGPLALDNAISSYAAAKKHIVSDVAGKADVLIVPNIVAGNIFSKALTYYIGAKSGNFVFGSNVPIVVPSRADVSEVKFNSILLALSVSIRKNLKK